jgi:hypothetical protein
MGSQKGAKSPLKLWHCSTAPFAVGTGGISPDVEALGEPSGLVVGAADGVGNALSVVAAPLMVVSTGVTVEVFEFVGSMVIQGFKADAVTAGRVSKGTYFSDKGRLKDTHQLDEQQGSQKRIHSLEGRRKSPSCRPACPSTRAY